MLQMGGSRSVSVLLLLILLITFFSVFQTKSVGAVTAITKGYRSIQEAIDMANAGDTVFVEAGVYYEHLFVDKPLSLIGENRETTVVDAGGTGTVVVVNSDNVTFRGFAVRNSGGGIVVDTAGIHLNYTHNCLIENNAFVDDAMLGVRIYFSHNATVRGNVITRRSTNGGILMQNSDYCTIRGNRITECGGIHLGNVNNSVIQYNNITANGYGITLGPVENVTICGNTVASNSQSGIAAGEWAKSSVVYHNNFNNEHQYTQPGTLKWANGYPSGGNYWSNYNGSDRYSGSGQDLSGSDGIGDVHYGPDQYPLMRPWGTYAKIVTPSLNTEIKTANVTVEWELVETDPGLNSYQVRLDGSQWVSAETATQFSLSDLRDGNHTVYVKTTDREGNSLITTTSFTVNTSPLGGPGYLEETILTIAVTAGLTIATERLLLFSRKRRPKQTEPSKSP